jgi:hypothetical protein
MRRSLVLAACGLLVAAAAGVSVWRIPDAARDAQGNVDRVAGLGRLDRVLSAGREFDLETDTYVSAAGVIPPGATYYVATGTKGIDFTGYQGSVPQVLFEAPIFARYFFLPRRQTIDPNQADWIYSYGGDLDALRLKYRRVIVLKPGWEVAEVAR